ncbi:capsid cement protein [Moellerella wisconsensis]|uniref:capsid cement protein n=1 Tax=Moellerella wisconsensis TaxID=158849 RepID=UPI003076133E
MAKNYQQQGLTVEIINTGTAVILSGALVMVGALACIAATNIEVGETGDGFADGVFLLPKKAGLALTAGQAVTADKGIVADKGGVAVGVTWEAAEASAEFVLVKINIFPTATAAVGG